MDELLSTPCPSPLCSWKMSLLRALMLTYMWRETSSGAPLLHPLPLLLLLLLLHLLPLLLLLLLVLLPLRLLWILLLLLLLLPLLLLLLLLLLLSLLLSQLLLLPILPSKKYDFMMGDMENNPYKIAQVEK